MKNKDFFKEVFKNFILKLGIWSFAILFLVLLIPSLIKFFDFGWLYDIAPNFYSTYKRLYYNEYEGLSFWLPILIVWLLGIMVFINQLLIKIRGYTNAIIKATEEVMDEENEFIELPKELQEFSLQMNKIKQESIQNKKMALENEQRKNDLIVYLAHDLKTPLTSTIGYLSLLDEVKDMPKKQREKYIKIALEKSFRLEELINELFDIARFNSEKIILEKENINLNLMLEQIIDDFYPILKENNKKIVLNIKEKITLNLDSDKMARVFANIIKNAINYSTDSTITIEVINRVDDVEIIITNQGKKIPEEKLKRIFEKFYRADSSRTTKNGGSGLGLAIAKEIVLLHNGSIKATSDNKFTKFYVKLPIQKS